MHRPSQMEINYLPSLVSSVLICGYTLACLDLWEFFIPPPFSSKIVQRDPNRGPFLNYLQIAHPKKAIPQG